jgi:hypothetical protein
MFETMEIIVLPYMVDLEPDRLERWREEALPRADNAVRGGCVNRTGIY